MRHEDFVKAIESIYGDYVNQFARKVLTVFLKENVREGQDLDLLFRQVTYSYPTSHKAPPWISDIIHGSWLRESVEERRAECYRVISPPVLKERTYIDVEQGETIIRYLQIK